MDGVRLHRRMHRGIHAYIVHSGLPSVVSRMLNPAGVEGRTRCAPPSANRCGASPARSSASPAGRQYPCFRNPGSAGARGSPGMADQGRNGQSGRRPAGCCDGCAYCTSRTRRRRRNGHRQGWVVQEGRRASRHQELIRRKREAPHRAGQAWVVICGSICQRSFGR